MGTKVICISREFGSGGHELGVLAGARLGIKVYEKELLHMACRYGDVAEKTLRDSDERATNPFLFQGVFEGNYHVIRGLPTSEVLFSLQSHEIIRIAKREDCIIVGRCADFVLRNETDVERGIPAEEIAFIHDAKTEVQKAALFTNVRRGNVRILIGSTAKMEAGTNVQRKLVAEHHLDIPWRPSDIEQREGRMIRQGNTNETVEVFRYVTENTFDAYMWQTIESKQKFISQIMTSKSPVRSCEDIDETALSYNVIVGQVRACRRHRNRQLPFQGIVQ